MANRKLSIISEKEKIYNKIFLLIIDELVKSHISYVVHASTSSARTEYQ
jgi:hypothetical protein